MADRYWVQNSGEWDDTTHWSVSSGGLGGETIPTSADNVYFDINSFTDGGQYLTVSGNCFCNSMDWSNVLYIPTLKFNDNSNITLYGNLTLVYSMYIEYPLPDLISFAHSSFMLEYTPIISCFIFAGNCHLYNGNQSLPSIESTPNSTLYLEGDINCPTLWIKGNFYSQGHNITTQGIKFESI